MKERKNYEEAKIELVDFGAQDIITTSDGVNDTPSGSGTIGTAGWDLGGWT